MPEPITLQAVVHGNRVEIPVPPGYLEGQAVTVTLSPANDSLITASLPSGIAAAFGILSVEQGEDLDQFLIESRGGEHDNQRDHSL